MRAKSVVVPMLTFVVGLTVGLIALTIKETHHAPIAPKPIMATAPKERRILYYRSPMNPAIHSPVPMTDNMGMHYLPVYAHHSSQSGSSSSPSRRILYYRSPMNPAIHSPVPMTDNMGMHYLPVYAHRHAHTGRLSLTPDLLQSYGVRTAPVQKGLLSAHITVPGIIEVDQHRQATVSTRVDGWLTTLPPDAIGDHIYAGEVVGHLYAPTLRAAESDYLMLYKEHSDPLLLQAAAQRLSRLGLNRNGRHSLLQEGRVPKTVPLYAPEGGIIESVQGAPGRYVTPGTPILTIAALTQVWAVLSLPPTDAADAKIGNRITIMNPIPGKAPIHGTISYLYPTVNTKARTLTVRAPIPNPHNALKPGLYVNAYLDGQPHQTLFIPRTAVLHNGTGIAFVFVALGHGQFRLQSVITGVQDADNIAIIKGLHAHQRVVVHGTFLLDADSHIHGLAARLQSASKEQP